MRPPPRGRPAKDRRLPRAGYPCSASLPPSRRPINGSLGESDARLTGGMRHRATGGSGAAQGPERRSSAPARGGRVRARLAVETTTREEEPREAVAERPAPRRQVDRRRVELL